VHCETRSMVTVSTVTSVRSLLLAKSVPNMNFRRSGTCHSLWSLTQGMESQQLL